MKNTWTPGICIAVFCGIWQLIMGVTGWYKDPVMMKMFWVVILIQVICLIWGLSRTAKDGKRYLAQVGLWNLHVRSLPAFFCFSFPISLRPCCIRTTLRI